MTDEQFNLFGGAAEAGGEAGAADAGATAAGAAGERGVDSAGADSVIRGRGDSGAAAVEAAARGGPLPAAERELPDAAARERIRTDLTTNLIVEAGAGAGKTTAMVSRMVALVRTGTATAGEIAAVTFTRKAASELRERFQTALEQELRAAVESDDTAAVTRLDAALREIDRAFLGTIHAFCARLLRERPLEAGVDPMFRETLGGEEVRLRRVFWHGWLESLAVAGDDDLAALRDVGLRPQQLEPLFDELSSQPDVTYPAVAAPRPDSKLLRRQVEQLMDRAATIMPSEEPTGGYDGLQSTLRMLKFHRFVLGWSDDARFFDVLGALSPGSFAVTKNKWDDGDAAKELGVRFRALFEDGGPADMLRREWWAYRYPLAVALARRAATAYQAERVRAGTLNFQDLLMFTARLLRESPPARRELSDRYRYILVDEFQDTDPVQAEVLFLLASDEEPALFESAPEAMPGGWTQPYASWRHLTPRPGALFVVGDPKQSIYRFRRADVALYEQVRKRFDVVELTSNFRSTPPIGRFVNENFSSRFPERGSDVQASYAPMLVQRDSAQACVCWYELDDSVHRRVNDLADEDAHGLAAWIAARIERGERRPGDFLVITPNTTRLARYASALERRNVPVQVTGAGAAGPESVELDELRLLLRALADPGDPSLTVAVLVGLFFGIDYEDLTRHAETHAGAAAFSFTREWAAPATAVERALQRLRHFWMVCRRQPADLAVAALAEELGVLPFAAAGELGGSRAGAVLFALDVVRGAALHGDATLTGAIAALDAALDEGDSEAPLEPGRRDVVRVMNLHKAKGLEATVVVLAAPFSGWPRATHSRIVRDDRGSATGFRRVVEERARKEVTLVQPADWDAHEAEERRYRAAEDDRLLYVAATRAAEELVIGCAHNSRSPSEWRSFHPWLETHGTRIEMPVTPRVPRPELEVPDDAVAAEFRQVAEAVTAPAGYRAATVSQRKAGVAAALAEAEAGSGAEAEAGAGAGAGAGPLPEGRGTDWGSAVHDALQLAAEGVTGEALMGACRNLLVAAALPVDADGEPEALGELLATVEAVLASPLWQRASSSPDRLVEVPFALAVDAADYAAMAGADPDTAPLEIIEGRIDLVFRDDAGWVVVDYKSDAAGASIPGSLMRRYRAQLGLYASAWQRITGAPVQERVLLFTATGEAVVVPAAASA